MKRRSVVAVVLVAMSVLSTGIGSFGGAVGEKAAGKGKEGVQRKEKVAVKEKERAASKAKERVKEKVAARNGEKSGAKQKSSTDRSRKSRVAAKLKDKTAKAREKRRRAEKSKIAKKRSNSQKDKQKVAARTERKERTRSLKALARTAEYVRRESPTPMSTLSPMSSPLASPPPSPSLPLSIQPYEAAFIGAEEWDAPSAWRFSRGLQLNGAGVGLLREKIAGRFGDLQIISNVELAVGDTVSFIVRARDKRNYYLVRLTGAGAAYAPNKLRVFAVKDGEAQPFGSPISLSGFDLKEQFALHIKLTGNRFEFMIEDSGAGLLPAGVVYDPEHTYAAGAVGVAASDNEQARILRFYVSPEQSMSQRFGGQ